MALPLLDDIILQLLQHQQDELLLLQVLNTFWLVDLLLKDSLHGKQLIIIDDELDGPGFAVAHFDMCVFIDDLLAFGILVLTLLTLARLLRLPLRTAQRIWCGEPRRVLQRPFLASLPYLRTARVLNGLRYRFVGVDSHHLHWLDVQAIWQRSQLLRWLHLPCGCWFIDRAFDVFETAQIGRAKCYLLLFLVQLFSSQFGSGK